MILDEIDIEYKKAAAFCNGFPIFLYSRGERIRTSDPLVPNQVLYQAEPRPELSPERELNTTTT